MKTDLQFLRREDGFTMGVVTIAAFIATTVATVALATATRRPQRQPDRPRAEAGLRRRPGGHQRLRLPPQQRHGLLGSLHQRSEPERGQPRRLDHAPPRGARRRRARPTRSSCCRRRASRRAARRSRRQHARDEHQRHDARHVPDPLHRLRRRLQALRDRHLQAPQLPRLHLLHPVRNARPDGLRRSRTSSPTPAPTASGGRVRAARRRAAATRGARSSPSRTSTTSTARSTPTTRSRRAAARRSVVARTTWSRSARRLPAG